MSCSLETPCYTNLMPLHPRATVMSPSKLGDRTTSGLKKVVIFQSPAHLYEVVPAFYRELQKTGYLDTFYLATDMAKPWGLGSNVEVVTLPEDLGWEGNLKELLRVVPEDIFLMMCDDHVTVTQTDMDLDPYYRIMADTPNLGRLQLSPPTRNYYLFLKAHRLPVTIPDDRQPWYVYDRRYRWHLNFQPSLWRRDYLLDAIEGGGNRSQLEARASERARRNKRYQSGYIGQHAIRYQNFLASCQVHHTDPSFHRKKKTSHYREEFVAYAVKHALPLDMSKRVHVRRFPFGASVPVPYYMQHLGNVEAFRKYQVKRNRVVHTLSKFGRRLRAKVAPYLSFSGR